MIHDYLDSFVVGVDGNEPMDLLDFASDETEKIKQFLKGELEYPVADAIHYASRKSLHGIKAILKDEYSDYDITFVEYYGEYEPESIYIVGKSDENSVHTDDSIPFTNFDSWTVVISSVPYSDIRTNPSLLESAFLVAYGVNFLIPPEPSIPEPEPIPAPEPTDIEGPAKLKYVESLKIKKGQEDITNILTNETQSFLDIIKGNKEVTTESYAKGTYYSADEFRGIEFNLKEEYRGLHVGYMWIEGYEGEVDYHFIENEYDADSYNDVRILDYYTVDSFYFIVSNKEIQDILDNPDLAETEFVHVYGITMKKGEAPEEIDELPPEIINTTDLEDTQFVRVLDGTTLAEYSIVPDVYNVKISQSINGAYTLNFNLLPYTNASNIYTPRIVEVDNEYFHVQTITKRHELQNLEMDIHCEHVSYELNYPPSEFFDDVAGKHVWSEDTYEGTAREILQEILQYNERFSIGLVENSGEHTFKTSSEGFRSRINEFAEYIGLEVKWSKFTVSLLKKRGHDNGVVFEVGKNIIGLTEVIDTVKLGKTKRSYELDVIDLNYVEDDLKNPLEAHNIVLGDVITIIDEQYRISRQDRVVALTHDPFKKALPTIEFTNNMSSYTASNSGTGGAAIDLPIYQEKIKRNPKANAFGLFVEATGKYSFSEGMSTRAQGECSHAEGYNTTAEGNTGHSEGWGTKATGIGSHAEGYETQSLGNYSHSQGIDTVASGRGSHSEGGSTLATGEHANASGYGCLASGYTARASGYRTQATGYYANSQGSATQSIGVGSHSEGGYTIAKGNFSHAEGMQAVAEASYSHAEGNNTIAKGLNSHAQGQNTTASSPSQMAMGRYNIEEPTANDYSINQGQKALIIGNGNGIYGTYSNAFSVKFDGQVSTVGAYNTGGADYSEYFEWTDGNPNNEDRRGYVTTFEADKIRLANANDHYILGVISSNPSIVGNAQEEQWHGLYITDVWGNYEYHYVDEPYTEYDEEGKPFTKYRKQYVPKTNPNYDPSNEYIPRSQRKEWDAVGMLGKLLVRDDGTCQINKYAKISEAVDGTLTYSDERSQFFVLRRVNENLVEVLIK